MNITKEHYNLRSYLAVYHSPVEVEIHPVNTKPNGFGSYTEAWDYIYSHRNELPANVSVVEMYKPTSACKRTSGGVRGLMVEV